MRYEFICDATFNETVLKSVSCDGYVAEPYLFPKLVVSFVVSMSIVMTLIYGYFKLVEWYYD